MARSAFALLLTLTLATGVRAHYNMLLPEVAYAKKGVPVKFTYQWGHPFEHELFDAALPASLVAVLPNGQTVDLASKLEKTQVAGADKRTVSAFHFRYVPEQRGDHTFVLTTPPIFLDGSNEFVEDIVKVVLHVTTQNGWDADPGGAYRIVPLTRPYGLYSGMVFRARVLNGAEAESRMTQPAKNALVEYERYNPVPPKELPIDELITFKTKTDTSGVLSVAFPEPGWWCVSVQRDAGMRAFKGKRYPLRQRVILWLHVDAKR